MIRSPWGIPVEMEASLRLVEQCQVWAQPLYDDDGRCLWRVLPGQGDCSGALLRFEEAEFIRTGKVSIELHEVVRPS